MTTRFYIFFDKLAEKLFEQDLIISPLVRILRL